MTTTLITSIITFAATNIDDIFVLMLFYSQTNKTFRAWHVVAGQYLGFTALVLISLLGFLGGLLIAREWIGLLGFLPIIIGVRHWLHRNDLPEDDLDGQKVSKAGVLSAIFGVSGVTFANGGDNIGIYTPLFCKQRPRYFGNHAGCFLHTIGCLVSHRILLDPAQNGRESLIGIRTLHCSVCSRGVGNIYID